LCREQVQIASQNRLAMTDKYGKENRFFGFLPS
jgi:hypothetical protein